VPRIVLPHDDVEGQLLPAPAPLEGAAAVALVGRVVLGAGEEVAAKTAPGSGTGRIGLGRIGLGRIGLGRIGLTLIALRPIAPGHIPSLEEVREEPLRQVEGLVPPEPVTPEEGVDRRPVEFA
jgi:hypothetical protein